ncbi:putative phage tail assembly chaperone [Bacterioplanoides sp.]|uniref:putative phage tail assembly chaperone n=1 Tax=Bacterioplanoides sp. TaxID=2066072 RepID=UPI003B596EB6
MNEKTIEVQIGDKELMFKVTLEDYNNCINALQMENKVAPMHNFLVITSANENTKEAVKQAFHDALTSDLFGAVVKEFKPDVAITVKKSSTGQGALTRTDSPS